MVRLSLRDRQMFMDLLAEGSLSRQEMVERYFRLAPKYASERLAHLTASGLLSVRATTGTRKRYYQLTPAGVKQAQAYVELEAECR